jgi:16S rRNA (adenine1518-N6/adenine1519-N6)-dimethyltransferase
MPQAANRQSISYLTRRFKEVGIEPNSRHGQNFLIDLNLLGLLADSAAIARDDVILEVGTGTGSLTAQLAARAAAVVTVEVDRRMYQLAGEELIEYPNVTMMLQDALANKNTLSPAVMAEVRRELAAAPNRRFKLVANLPYNIATPVLSNLLSTDPLPATMTATIQKEVADRLMASPATKDYGALSIWVQSQCRVELIRTLPPQVFWPKPKVTSAIVQIRLDPELRSRVPDLVYFHQFVRSMFLHRRKLLRGVLVSSYKEQLGKSGVDALLEQLGLSPTARAEELDVAGMLALCEAVRAEAAKSIVSE